MHLNSVSVPVLVPVLRHQPPPPLTMGLLRSIPGDYSTSIKNGVNINKNASNFVENNRDVGKDAKSDVARAIDLSANKNVDLSKSIAIKKELHNA